jgi:hypothetical protein
MGDDVCLIADIKFDMILKTSMESYYINHLLSCQM